MDIAALSEAWNRQWPTVDPIAYALRSAEQRRWVRFHSLPESKRYATTDAEHAEILRRHHVLLRELLDETGGRSLTAITCSWSSTAKAVPRDVELAKAAPDATHWRSENLSDDPDFDSWQHNFVSTIRAGAAALDQLLLLVADYRTGGVILADPALRWLYHPYDGGADVIATSVPARDRLAETYSAWLSKHPAGL